MGLPVTPAMITPVGWKEFNTKAELNLITVIKGPTSQNEYPTTWYISNCGFVYQSRNNKSNQVQYYYALFISTLFSDKNIIPPEMKSFINYTEH